MLNSDVANANAYVNYRVELLSERQENLRAKKDEKSSKRMSKTRLSLIWR